MKALFYSVHMEIFFHKCENDKIVNDEIRKGYENLHKNFQLLRDQTVLTMCYRYG
jgi:hypothetical protein